MLINELFTSIDGEARRAGELATFIRTVGCNLRCKFCDSQYTWGHESTNKEMTCEQIKEECDKFGVENITFTGGEPLLQKDSDTLITLLADNGYDVSIETDGGIDFTERDWFKNNEKNIWVCADYKCYASGMTHKMISLDKFAMLREQDVLKFVVGSQKDLDLAKSVIDYIRNKGSRCYCYLSPVFGMIKPVDIVEYMQKYNMQDRIRCQIQLHKAIWKSDARMV